MTAEVLKKFNKEVEQEAIKILKDFTWYKGTDNKAAVLVEDILPILMKFITKEKLKQI